MELIMDYKEGNLMNEGNTLYLVLFKTIYNIVILEFSRNMLVLPYSEWNNNLPLFSWKNYNLTNRDDVEELNNKFVVTSTNNLVKFPDVYKVEVGSVIEYDYKQLMLMGQTDRKVLTFTLTRPILFDFNKAKEKYIVFDRLNKLNDLQGEFNANWSEYFITPLASKENIDWSVVKDKLPFEEVIGKEFINKEFAPYPTEEIRLEDFYNVIDTKKLNAIKDESIKKEIKELIKQTLILGKENNSIGSKSEPKKPVEPIIESIEENAVIDENANKTLYKINVVVSAMEKDGGTKYSKIYDVYADSENEALDKIRKKIRDDIKLTDLYYDYDEVVEVIPPTKKTTKLSNLKKGDRFIFPLSQEDKDMGVSEMIYVFDSKEKSTYFYKSGDSNFSTSENREVTLLSESEPTLEKPIEETEDLADLLALYEIEETENMEDLLKLNE